MAEIEKREVNDQTLMYDFQGLKVQFEPKIVRVDNDEALDRLFNFVEKYKMDETEGDRKKKLSKKEIKKLCRENALEMASLIRNCYKEKYGKELKITRESLAIEIYGHYYILMKSEAYEKKHGSKKFTRWLKRHMDVIDCGERDVDNNRFVWDFLQVLWKDK